MQIGWIILGVSLAAGPLVYGVPSLGYEGIQYSGGRTPYVVDESIPAQTETDYGAKIGFSISREEFSRVQKSTWADSGVPGWPRGEWLYYGTAASGHDFIGIGVTQRARDNTYRYTVERSLSDIRYLKDKNLRRGINESELETDIGIFETLDFRATFHGKETDCFAFSASKINAAVVIDGYYCGGNQSPPSRRKLARILGTLKAPRFKIDSISMANKKGTRKLLESAKLRN